jgi:hypothetical protein
MIHRRVLRARKEHWCSGDHAHDRRIRPGELYQRMNMSPGHAGMGSLHWQTLAKCSQCIHPYALLQHFMNDRKGRALVAAIHQRKENQP